MPRRSTGPHLWFQKARYRDGKLAERATWIIRDGNRKRRTGASEGEADKAQRALADYIIERSGTPRVRDRDPAAVWIADVISIYQDDVVEKHARPKETKARLVRLLDHFGEMSLSQMNGKVCRSYAEKRGQAAARRELEDLRAAITHHWREGLCATLTPVVLPERGRPRERWLTRSEAARLLRTAWRMPRGKHVARFILVALYTGTRAGAICGAGLKPTEGRGWIDLDNGVFYRRAAGRRETKKRQTPVRLPPGLLAHLRRWERLRVSRKAVVEFNGKAVGRINKAFRSVRAAVGFGSDVVPHTLRHTCATWLAQSGVPLWEAAGFLAMTQQTFEAVYGHHHPDHQQNAVNAFGSHRQHTDKIGVNETAPDAINVTRMHRIA